MHFAFAFGTILIEEFVNFIKKCDDGYCFNLFKKQQK